MTFGQFLSILKARWIVGVAVLAATVLLTLAASLLLPKQYTATASVLVDIRPDPISAIAFPSMVQPAILATQVDVITSDRVARRVVSNLKLIENPAVRQQFQDDTGGQGSIETWMADLLSKKLDVKPSRDSSVINVSYRAQDPAFAAAIANAFVQAYVQTTLELRVNPAKQYSSFFDQQSKDARAALERAQTRLSAFQRENGIVASDERLDVENARLNELSSQVVLLQAMSAESKSRETQAQGSGADRLQEVLNNPVIAGLKTELARSEARLQELNSRYGVNHPLVIETKANIAEQRAKLEAETRRVTGGVGVANTINRQREAQIRGELEAQRAKVLKLKAARDEVNVLMKDVDNAQKTYDAVIGRLTQTNLESQTTQSNVSVLTPAQAPLEASFPKVPLNTLLAIFVGILLAIGVAMLLEMRDRRLRSLADIRSLVNLPVLGILPSGTAKRAGRRRQLQIEQRVLGGLPAPKGGV